MASTRDPETRLRMFVAQADKAVSRRAIRDGTIMSRFTLTGSAEKSSMEVDTGDDDDLLALLVTFRPFVSEGEPVFANWVFKELGRRLTDDELRATARENRAHWDAVSAGPITIEMGDDGRLGALQCFDLIINSQVFHADEKKLALWNAMPEFARGVVLQQLTGFVVDGLRVLYPTRNLVVEALEKGLLDFS